jgi:hypothetical protein
VQEDQRLKSDKKIWKQKFATKKKNETMNRKGNRGASKPRDLLPENINLKLVPRVIRS